MPHAESRTPGVSVFTRPGRNVYYINYIDPLRPHRYRVQEATPFRLDDPEGMRKAHNLAMEKASAVRIVGDGAHAERWSSWVIAFLDHQYKNSPLTLRRYRGAWKWLGLFLMQECDVHVPRALVYKHVRGYHSWRTSFTKGSGRKVSGNTALDDLKVLRLLMNEAVKRGYAPTNPALRLKIPKEKVRHARELSATELALIEASLPKWVAENPKERGWMPVAYQIGRYQGCRLRETRLNLRTQVNLRDGTITFLIKGRKHGDGDVTAMHAKLRPLFESLIAAGQTWTLDYGDRPSILWRRFFDSIGLRDAWFHCLRSTVITEMARGGVPISQAMRYVLHANEEIHRAYQRLMPGDLGGAAGAIGAPASTVGAATSANLQAQVIALLVRDGLPMTEAVRRVMHGDAGKPTPP